MKRIGLTLALLACFLYLLLFPAVAARSVREGLILWYNRVLPALLPFMILSNFMIRFHLLIPLLSRIQPVFHFIWGTSLYGSYVILAGFLFGMPMGAKTIHDLRSQKLITDVEAEYLIGFVNNLSPAFVVSYLASDCMNNPSMLGPVLCILYGAPLISGLILSLKYRRMNFESCLSQEQSDDISCKIRKASKVPSKSELVDACIFDGINSITRLGAYILLFSILGGAIRQLPHLNPVIITLLAGSIEVTSGLSVLFSGILPEPAAFEAAMILSSFGGFCAWAQICSVCPMSGKMHLQFWKTKLMTIGLSAVMALYFITIPQQVPRSEVPPLSPPVRNNYYWAQPAEKAPDGFCSRYHSKTE